MKLDPAAMEFITQAQQTQATTQAKPERETRLRPHETERRDRQMNVTFRSPAWPEALRDMAERWGLRPADLVTWCVAQAISQVQAGEVAAPSGEERRQHHRACGWMDNLPWEPE